MPNLTVQDVSGRTIRCFLFDLGDTLWTRNKAETRLQAEQAANMNAASLLQEYFPAHSLPTTDSRLLGALFRITVERQVHRLSLQSAGYEPDYTLATLQALQRLQLAPVDRATANELYESLRVRNIIARHLFKDTLSTLHGLRERGFLLGIVSNRHYGGGPFMEDLREFGLLEFFEPRHIAVSADLSTRKPNPEIFLHVLRSFDIPPAEAAMVGDSLRADVAGAKALQMCAIWKPKPILMRDAKKELPSQSGYVDDEHLLAYVLAQEEKKYRQLMDDLAPNVIIRRLRDLLTFFPQAGGQ